MTPTHTKTHDYKRHEHDHWIDEIRVTTVPRWKTSGLSGNEWRFCYRIDLMRKGRVYAHRSFGFIEYATLQGATPLEPNFNINRALEEFADSLSTPQGTNERLAYALEEAGINDLVKRARDGEFSDFNSLHAMPKMVLHELLNEIGSDEAKAIDERMIVGEFDG